MDQPIAVDQNLDGDNSATGLLDRRLTFLQDALGSVVGLADKNGKLVEAYVYDPYGRHVVVRPGLNGVLNCGLDDQFTTTSAYGNAVLYTGQRYDPETGLHYYRARYYDSNAGRFVSRDPIGVWGDGINLGNPYAYVGGMPMDAKDPTGEFVWVLVAAGAGCLIGGGLSVFRQTRGGGEVDWVRAGAACAGGAVAGALTTTGIGAGLALASGLGASGSMLIVAASAAGLVSGGVGGGLGEITNQSILRASGRQCGGYDHGALGAAVAGGAVGGAIGGGLAGSAFFWTDKVMAPWWTNFRTATSLRGVAGYASFSGRSIAYQFGMGILPETGAQMAGATLASFANPETGPTCG